MRKVLETDSLVMINIIKEIWKILWEIIEVVEEIKMLVRNQGVVIQHIFREGNQLANFLANQADEQHKFLQFGDF